MIPRILACLALAMLLGGASPAPDRKQQAFKGYELYSWREAGEWRFALLIGTNRLKFCSEVRGNRPGMTLEELEGVLNRLAPIQHVSWRTSGFADGRDTCLVAYPPFEIVQRIRELCRKLELFLDDRASAQL